MKRAKFNPVEKQREFFQKVKDKLGVGSLTLSKKLGLSSRGVIESYTFMRTAPPVKIIKTLEELSGIKADYFEIEGKVYRKKRNFMPFDKDEAEKKLKEKFGKDFIFLTELIKSNKSIKEIIGEIRKRNYTFDNSLISRCIGAYRTDILSKIKDISLEDDEIFIRGHIRKDKNTLSINFNLRPLYNLLKQKSIHVGLEISKDLDKIRIYPLEFGRKLTPSNKAIKILITEKSGLKIKSNVKIVLCPKKFGFSNSDSIYDKDAKTLFLESIKQGFVLDPQRSTPSNHKGDLSLFINNKNIIIEITQLSSYKGSYFKIGQCFIQKNSWPKAIQYLVCKKKFLSKESENALKKLGVKIINTNFNKEWEKEIMENIKNDIK
jgi:hypothetical protein